MKYNTVFSKKIKRLTFLCHSSAESFLVNARIQRCDSLGFEHAGAGLNASGNNVILQAYKILSAYLRIFNLQCNKHQLRR